MNEGCRPTVDVLMMGLLGGWSVGVTLMAIAYRRARAREARARRIGERYR